MPNADKGMVVDCRSSRTSPMNNCIRLHADDDVVIARQQLLSGATVEGLSVRGLVPPGHKIATRDIAQGAPDQVQGAYQGL